MTLLLASAARAAVGGRSGQEDSFRLWPAEGTLPANAETGGLLAVLADGMGGHTGGAIAGQTACNTFTEVFSAANSSFEARLKTALQASNEALAKGVEQNAALKGMGCTIIAAWIDDLGIRWTSVGDSLLLLYRLPDVIRLNADHSLGSFLDEQARQNKITRSEARRNRNRNALRSALTGSKIDLIDLRGEPLELRPGDWVVLASDGICSLPGDEIADVIYRFRQSKPDEMAEGLIAAVTQKGIPDQDNTTVVVVRIDAADDVPTRVVARPKGEEVDLRTRRIGVSRRGTAPPASGGKTRAAVWLAAAVALVFCAVALMLAVPSLRPTISSNTEATGNPPGEPTTAPANAVVDPAPPASGPAKASAPKPSAPKQPAAPKSATEPPPQTAPSAPAPGRSGSPGSGQEGAVQSSPPAKSAATPPPAEPPPGQSEEGAPASPPPATAEEGPGTRTNAPGAPAAKPRTPVKAATPAGSPAKPGTAGDSPAPRHAKDQERKTKSAPPPIVGQPTQPPPENPGMRISTDPLSSTIE
jgi:PPM family protein phosphatase